MAFNLQTFRTRAVTALIIVVIMLAGLLWNHWSFFILFSVIHFGAWWEYLKLAEKIHQTIIHPYSKLGFMLIGYGLMLWFCDPVLQLNNYSLSDNFSIPVSGAGFSLLVIGIFQRQNVHIKSFGMAAMGWLYISLSWGLIMDLYGFETLRILSPLVTKIELLYLPLFTIICMWINDTMAYLVGSMIGKTPFSKISPKKTWEGTLGGIILAGFIVGWLGYFFDDRPVFGHSLGWWIFLAMSAAIAGTLGDLLKSKFKRMAGVKDSGSIMPGHGGFLDRFDSLLIATPVVWLIVHGS
ncbi:MAG TPA: phosphatidate cytidylyltransferase [Chitinophagaceae bacterium]|nr:phosphatidate cytidylyltransferase [Chitinophagaceae bacterium]